MMGESADAHRVAQIRCLGRVAPPAQAHALRLREWLEAQGYMGGSLVASDLRELYLRMCTELGWDPKPWNVIARAFALLTVEGRKVYAIVGGQRKRIYPLPAGPSSRPRCCRFETKKPGRLARATEFGRYS
jgi:hypothetical protein